MADATSTLNEISGALDGLAAQIVAIVPDDRIFAEIWGWNMPAINRHDFAELVRKPKELIQEMDKSAVDDADVARLQALPSRIQWVLANVMPNLPGGNAFHAYATTMSLVDSLTEILSRYAEHAFDLKELEDKKLLPAAQIKRLKGFSSGIDRLEFEAATYQAKVDEINQAHAVAESLPADMQSLQEAREGFEASKRSLENTVADVTRAKGESENALSRLAEIEKEARAVLSRANEAYGAATTVGLGKAFTDRANGLSNSTWILGVLLACSLGIAAYITYERVEFVHQLMLNPKVSYNVLWINLTFTALSVSAPVWFAWLLTRQIGQRFRLAEDYGYKAAVAKAYEGYRAEAAHIDDELAKRLFSIALDRLSEAPLRLVERDSPGSPAHEVGGPIARFFGRGGKGDRKEGED
ncbi:hypothetical protein [Phenylobacterium aquaticum]|uniref:hypothetical protein n=1 Tax=Phenylobacterium aquaticum TaxID=1763816 RepID=UPI001F5DCA01|nr:hypothetical protein [Phenylobacterium aquaticum]MCI3133144.1 hypothetical protein [Phenylobacterium aquaticum]